MEIEFFGESLHDTLSSNLFKDDFFNVPHTDDKYLDIHDDISFDDPELVISDTEWDQDVLLSNAVLPELNPLLEICDEFAEDNFQKMLNEWESHLGSMTETCDSTNVLEDVSSLNEPLITASTVVASTSMTSSMMTTSFSSSSCSSSSPSIVAKSGGGGEEKNSRSGKKTLAGIVISSGPGGHFETYEGTLEDETHETHIVDDPILMHDIYKLESSNEYSIILSPLETILEASDVDTFFNSMNDEGEALTPTSGTDPNRSSQIIAAVQNHFAGSSRNLAKPGQIPRIIPSQRIKDALPLEIIEKIKASSERSKTIAIIEPVPSKFTTKASSSALIGKASAGIASRFKEAASTLNRNKMRQLGIISNSSSSSSSQAQVSLDHDYCCPSRPKKGRSILSHSQSSKESLYKQQEFTTYPAAKKRNILKTESEFPSCSSSSSSSSRKEVDHKKDSGLESGDVSDASDSSNSGLYSRLPPYLTSVSVKNTDSQSVYVEESRNYDRLPPYIKGIGKTSTPPPETLLKNNTKRKLSLAQYRCRRDELDKKISDVTSSSSSSSSSFEEISINPPILSSSPRNYRKKSVEDSSTKSSSSDEYESSTFRRPRRHRRKRHLSSSEDSSTTEDESSTYNNHRYSSTRNTRFSRESQRREQENRMRLQDIHRQIEERRIVYVGKISENTTRAELRSRFEVFGPVLEISVHFRDRGDNYGFVTFRFKVDANEAVEHGNDDPSFPKVDLCFGGRRNFCKEKYSDLDSTLDDVENGRKNSPNDFDSLLKKARAGLKTR